MTAAKKPSFIFYHEKGTDGASVELEVRKQRNADVERASTAAEALACIARQDATALICAVNKLDLPFANFVHKAHSLNSTAISIIMAAFTEPQALATLNKLNRVIPLESPIQINILQLLCQKLAEGSEVKRRRHRRFSTDQSAVMEQLNGETQTSVRIFNIGKGGAYLECAVDVKLKTKDVIKLTIKLDELGKTREVHGKVMWATSLSSAKNKMSAGIEFINVDDAYMALLESD